MLTTTATALYVIELLLFADFPYLLLILFDVLALTIIKWKREDA